MVKLCGETVTLYHPDAAHRRVVRRVLRGVYWQQGRRALPDAGGAYPFGDFVRRMSV